MSDEAREKMYGMDDSESDDSEDENEANSVNRDTVEITINNRNSATGTDMAQGYRENIGMSSTSIEDTRLESNDTSVNGSANGSAARLLRSNSRSSIEYIDERIETLEDQMKCLLEMQQKTLAMLNAQQ